MARSLLKERHVPAQYWGEAVTHAVYLLNKLPTRAMSTITPHEAWLGTKPNVNCIKVFGCTAYMKIPAVHTKKLDDWSKMVVHFGREPGTKAFRLYDPKNGSIHVSRDVVFDEHKSWDWGTTPESDLSTGAQFTLENDVSEPELSREEDGSQFQASEATPTNSHSENEETEHSSVSSDDSEQAQRFRSLDDIYEHTTEVELADDELLLMGIDEPVCFEQAVEDSAWKVAMDREIDSIEKNKTWQLVDLPQGHKAIGLKWVYKLKTDQHGEVTKHKARLVAKGYVQRHGIDYEEVFAPVTRLETVRLLLALAAKNDWKIHHLDVKSAFLNGVIQEEVYVSQPKGYVKKGSEHKVYKLLKALYGLRQAPRAWYSRLNQCLLKLGFIKCPYEHAVYTKKEGDHSLIVGVYVDDLLVTGTSLSHIAKFKGEMSREFDMSDLGKLSYYLGLEVTQDKDFIELRQSTYARKVLEKAGMAECNAVKYPMEYKLQLHADSTGEPVNSTHFKSIIGGLRYLVHTRPDIAYTVGIVSRYMERPTQMHMNAVKLKNMSISERDIALWTGLYERARKLYSLWFLRQ